MKVSLDEIPDEKWNASKSKDREKRGGVSMPDPEKEFQSYYQYLELRREEKRSSPRKEDPLTRW